MELKFLLFASVLLFALFGGIESRKSGGGSRSHSTSRGHSTGSRGHSTGSRNTYRPKAPSPPPRRPTITHPATDFHRHESAHTTNTGNHNWNSRPATNPYQHATAPILHNNGGNSPLRPFNPVPKPPVTKPNGGNSPLRPFNPVPNPPVTRPNSFGKPTPPPIGFVDPSRNRPTAPTGHSHIHTTRPPPVNPHLNRPGHGHSNGRNNSFPTLQNGGPGGYRGPPIVPVTQRPYGLQPNRSSAGFLPSGPGIQQTRYPGLQGAQPVPGANYPYNPPPYSVQQPSHGSSVHIHNYHPLPPNPVQTVVVVPGGGSTYHHRTTGDIFQEAIIHAGVNAAVNRLVNPHPYGHSYGHSYDHSYGHLPAGQSTVTTTNMHTVNNNYYGQTSAADGSVPAIPGSSNAQPPPGGIQGGGFNGVNNPGNYGGSAGSPGTVKPGVPSNGQSVSVGNNGPVEANSAQVVTDQELWNITEQLFRIDENNGSKFITLNLQNRDSGNNTNISDTSPQPLFTMHPDVYKIPTVKGIRSLYEAAAAVENKTRENSRKEENLFVNLVLNTNVMTVAMDFLSRKNLMKNDYYEHKDILNHIWFTPYEKYSSGFKRVFQGESLGEGFFWGLQDWTAFDFQEKTGRANYLSYVEKLDLGTSSPNLAILKANFNVSKAQKAGASIFVGISPELQMALYTICHYVRPDNFCDVSLGGTHVRLYTHTFRYFGKDLIDAAFPIL